MSIETEKKYRLTEASRRDVANALEEYQAEFVKREFEENTIYSSPYLRETEGMVRLRRTEDRSTLTYKRRVNNDGGVKEQIEYESGIDDVDSVEKIITALGLKPGLVYEKYRDTWKFRSVEVVLDELPFGLYMEVEGSLTAIREAEMLLDLDALETEHETYPRLTMKMGTDNNGVIEARFAEKNDK